MSKLTFLSALFLAMGVPSAAHAQGDPAAGAASDDAARETAAQLFGEAKAALQAKDWERCRVKALAAWKIYQAKAKLAGLLGECELRSGHAAAAAGHLRLSLDKGEPSPKLREHGEALFEEARKLVGAVEIRVDVAGAALTVDGEPLDGAVAYLSPGVHRVAARAEGYPERTVEVTARAGAREVVRIELVRVEDAPPVDENGDSEGSGAYPWVVGIGAGLTVVAIASGIGLRVAAGGKEDDAAALEAQSLASGGCSGACPDVFAAYEDADALFDASTGLLVGGAVLGLATLGYAIFALPDDPDRPVAHLPLPILHPGFAGALWMRSF